MPDDPAASYTELVQQSQQAVLAAVDAWTKTVKEALAQMPDTPGQLDASGVVDQVFDVTEKVLQVQRDLAKRLVTSSGAAAEALRRSAEQASDSE